MAVYHLGKTDRQREREMFYLTTRNTKLEHCWNDTDGKAEVLRENPVLVPLYQSQIPHGLVRDRARASLVRDRRLTAWTMTRLSSCEMVIHFEVRKPCWPIARCIRTAENPTTDLHGKCFYVDENACVDLTLHEFHPKADITTDLTAHRNDTCLCTWLYSQARRVYAGSCMW